MTGKHRTEEPHRSGKDSWQKCDPDELSERDRQKIERREASDPFRGPRRFWDPNRS